MSGSRTRVVVGGLTLSFVLALVLGVSGVIAPRGGIAVGASTVLTIISGDVQVSSGGGAFAPATDGAVLAAGHTLRTGPDGRAILTYFEGSTVSVEPSTELAIDEATAHPDGSTVVTMTQNLGRTWHVVTRLISGESRYEVRTPAATASVRGTGFEVGVVREANGEIRTEIATTEGIVAASAPATAADPRPEPVVVAGGFQTSAMASERRMEQPRLSPEAERRVTVTVGSGNSIVVDPLGRANGMRDGRLVLQTPGAQLTRVDGKLVITLPNLPDGKISTVVKRAAGDGDVPVTTTVQERGRPAAQVEDALRGTQTVTGVELRRSAPSDDAPPALRRLDESEKQEIKPPKVASAPEPLATPRPRLGLDGTRRPVTAEQASRAADEARDKAEQAAREATEKAAKATVGDRPKAEQAAEQAHEKADRARDEAKDKADRARDEQPRTAERTQAPPGRDEDRQQPRSPGFVRPLPFHGAPATETRPPTRRPSSPADEEAARQLERAAEQARRAAEAERERLKERQEKAAQEAKEAAEKAKEAEQERKDAQERVAKAKQEKDKAEQEAREAKDKADQKAREDIAHQRAKDAAAAEAKLRDAEEQKRALERERQKADREAAENAERQRRLQQAERDAQKIRDSVKPPAVREKKQD